MEINFFVQRILMKLKLCILRDKIVEELFVSLLERYQEGLEESMKRSECISDSIVILQF